MPNAWQIYLKNEYDNTMKIAARNRDLISVRAEDPSSEPCVESYIVTYNVPTWVKDGAHLRIQQTTVVRVTLSSRVEPPHAHVIKGLVPYHPNWFTSGLVCNGSFSADSRVINYINFVMELLQFKSSVIDITSPANNEAAEYWIANGNNRSMFPTDTRTMSLTEPKLKIRIKSSHK